MRKLHAIGLMAALSTSKHSIAGSVVAGLSAALIGPTIGIDPVLWATAAGGAVLGKFKNPSTSRTDTAVNGVISVLVGGLGAPIAMYAVKELQYSPPYQAELMAALILAIAWPFIAKQVPELYNRVIDKFLPKRT